MIMIEASRVAHITFEALNHGSWYVQARVEYINGAKFEQFIGYANCERQAQEKVVTLTKWWELMLNR
jgi:hypothetical protein